MHPFRLLLLAALLSSSAARAAPQPAPDSRIASIFISQDFINEQLASHSKSQMVQEVKLSFDPDKKLIYVRGKILVPVEELRAVNLDSALGEFRFQVTIEPSVTKKGYLVLDFPLDQTFFYPAVSKDPQHERIVIPVQLLSLVLASARGYLSVLSGDFSSFDRRTAKLKALMEELDRSIAHQKNQDALADLKNQREALRLQLEAVPVERKQLETVAKEIGKMMGFTGEKELNLNNELGARKNALVLKIKLAQLTPYLDNMELGGLRFLLDKKDGNGETYMAIDLNSDLAEPLPPKETTAPHVRTGMKIAPSLIMRLNQSLFESDEVLDSEKKDMPSNIRDLEFALRDDGLHVTGKYHTFLFFNVSFETIVDISWVGDDVFDVKVRKLEAGGVNLGFMEKFVLESMKKRLNHTLKGMCKFKYVGEESDHTQALRVTVDPKTLVPAFPDLHLVDVDVRDREFLLKIGHSANGAVATTTKQ